MCSFLVKPSNVESEESSDDNTSTHNDHNVNKGWDSSAHIVTPRAGARLISIKAQSPALQTIVKAAIREITGDALFSTAYPSAVTIVKYYCDILGSTAMTLNFLSIYQRFKDDDKFAETVSRVVRYPVLVLLPCLIFDHSWLSVFPTSVVALRKWPQRR
jgi:hypothetical protein